MAGTQHNIRPSQKELKSVISAADDIIQKIYRLQSDRNALILEKSEYASNFSDLNSIRTICILHDRIYTKELFLRFHKYEVSLNDLIEDKKTFRI